MLCCAVAFANSASSADVRLPCHSGLSTRPRHKRPLLTQSGHNGQLLPCLAYGNCCNVCRIDMISTMRAARATTGSALSVFEAGAAPFDPASSSFRPFCRHDPADPFIARERRNVHRLGALKACCPVIETHDLGKSPRCRVQSRELVDRYSSGDLIIAFRKRRIGTRSCFGISEALSNRLIAFWTGSKLPVEDVGLKEEL